MTQCISFYSWSFTHFDWPQGSDEATYMAEAEVYGVGPQTPYLLSFVPWVQGEFTPRLSPDLLDSPEFTGRGRVQETSSIDPAVRPTTLDDPLLFVFGLSSDGNLPSGSTSRCVSADYAGRGDTPLCARVPEPSTYLLMLTGIMGLGMVAWRRRETLA